MSDRTNGAGFNPTLPMKPMRLSVPNLTEVLYEALEEGMRLGMRRPILNEYIHALPVAMHDAAPPGHEEVTSLTQMLLAAAEERFPEAWNLALATEVEDTLEDVLLDGIRIGVTTPSAPVECREDPNAKEVVQSHLRRLVPTLIKAGQAIHGAEELLSAEPPVQVDLYATRTDEGVTVRSGWMLELREGGRYQLRLEATSEEARISARRCGARDFVERREVSPSELRVLLQMIVEVL